MTATITTAGTIVRRAPRAAARLVAAGSATAVAFATGAILELTNLHWHDTQVHTAAQRITMIAFVVGLLASVPLLAALGRASGRVGLCAARAVIGAQVTIAALTIDSVIQGHDAAFFNPVAALTNAIWLTAAITLAVSLLRHRAVPLPLAIGVAVAYVCTIPWRKLVAACSRPAIGWPSRSIWLGPRRPGRAPTTRRSAALAAHPGCPAHRWATGLSYRRGFTPIVLM